MMLLTTTLLSITLIHHTLNTTPSPHTTTTHHSLTTHLHPPQTHTTHHHKLNLIASPNDINGEDVTKPQHTAPQNTDITTKWISKYSIAAPQQDRTALTDDNTNNLRHSTRNIKITKRSITKASHNGTLSTAQTEESNLAQTNNNVTRGDGERRRRRRRRKGKGRRQADKRRQRGRRRIKDLSLWIDQNQVKMFSGYLMEIFVIHNSRVLPYVLDPNFEKQLPVIPAQVENVNFTWCSGNKKYQYTFEHLQSEEETLLGVPTLSIPTQGTVPRKPRVFSVDMRCSGNVSGIATFRIGLIINTPQGDPLPGMPLRLRLRKECRHKGPDPECDLKCQNGGVCDGNQQCQCPEGYMGQYCDKALCYPQCLNGGSCTTPGKCSCPPGFQGRHCEGGICQNKCKNGGKCIQKDRCKCRRGFFGNWCQYSQCFVACINGGKCRGVNKCRCPLGFTGDHCEVLPSGDTPTTRLTPRRCHRKCHYGQCHGGTCQCHHGYTGRWCRRRSGRGGEGRKRVWVR